MNEISLQDVKSLCKNSVYFEEFFRVVAIVMHENALIFQQTLELVEEIKIYC